MYLECLVQIRFSASQRGLQAIVDAAPPQLPALFYGSTRGQHACAMHPKVA